MTIALRFPAEWEPQSAILIAWPHAATDWAARLAAVEHTYTALVAAITRFQPVLIAVPDKQVQAQATACLAQALVNPQQVRFVTAAYNDTWLRDSGPVSLIDSNGYFELLDFRFTGWGGKFTADADDQLISALNKASVFSDKARVQHLDFALEGGAIETDGQGSLLTTWQCLHRRHPRLSRAQIEVQLGAYLRQRRVLWLQHGALEGDDTDAHIDTLARFASPRCIVYQGCDVPQDSHYLELQAMAKELKALRTLDNQPYDLLALPWPQAMIDHGRRLAASYANFLIINHAVLMPAYDDPADQAAVAVLARAFPDREIIPVPCRSLIWQNGSLHCLTMQLPAGVLREGAR